MKTFDRALLSLIAVLLLALVIIFIIWITKKTPSQITTQENIQDTPAAVQAAAAVVPALTLSPINGGQPIYSVKTYPIMWSSQNIPATAPVRISIVTSDNVKTVLETTTNTGNSSINISSGNNPNIDGPATIVIEAEFNGQIYSSSTNIDVDQASPNMAG